MLLFRLYGFIFCSCFLQQVTNAQQPELVLPVGHTDIVKTAMFSPDGKFVVTGSADKTAIVWETLTGVKVQTLINNEGSVNYAYFNNNNKFLAVGSDSSVIIWSVPEFTILAKYEGVRKTVFSPDNKYLFLQTYSGDVQQINLLTFKAEHVYHYNLVYEPENNYKNPRITVSPDGKLLCSTTDSILIITNVRNGQEVIRKRTNGVPVLSFFTNNNRYLISVTENGIQQFELSNNYTHSIIQRSWVTSAILSANNKFLLISGGVNLRNTSFWNAEKMQPIFHTDTIYSVYDTLSNIDKNGETIGYKNGTAAVGFPDYVQFFPGLAIAKNGNFICIRDVLWNCLDNTQSYIINDNNISKSDISPDGKYTLIQQKEGTVALWDIANRKTIQLYETRVDKISISAVSPDGSQFATGGNTNDIKLINAKDGTVRHLLKGHTDPVGSVYFSADSKKIITNSYDSSARIWDAVTGKLLNIYQGYHPDINPVWFFGQDSVVLPIVRKQNTTYLGIDEKEIDTLITILPENPDNIPNLVSRGGSYGVFKEPYNGANFIWGDSVKLKLPDEMVYHSLVNAFSEDEKWLAIAETNEVDSLLVGDLKTGNWLFRGRLGISSKDSYYNRKTEQLLFSHNNKYLLAVDGNEIIHILSTDGFKEVAQLPGKRCYISDDDKLMITINQGRCEVYDFTSRELLYSYVSIDSVNYLVFDKKKRFDGSEKARDMLYYVCGKEIVDLAQVKDQCWVPNLVERIMNGEMINSKTLEELDICGLTPEVEDMSSNSDEYYFKIKPRRGGLGETLLFVNGIEFKRYKPKDLLLRNGAYTFSIKKEELKNYFIPGRKNPVTVKAYTSDNTVSSRGLIINDDNENISSTPPSLFAVMVGVSDYKGEELDLKYAAKDATDISNAVMAASKKLLNTDSVEHVFMYNLTTSPKRYLLPEKNSIKKVLEEIGNKATANDILFIFFAGHGVMTGNGENKQFYFLTADASSQSAVTAVKDVGISTAELSEWMKPQNIKAQKRILIFDACNSGQAINDFVQLGKPNQGYIAARNDDKSQQIKAIDKLNEKSGLYILSASATNQNAYEMGRYSQGLLTYSLLKVIKQQPDILEEGKYLNVSRWFNAAEKMVSELSKESGARQQPQIVTNTNFNIGLVDDEVLAKIILPQEKPLFAASNFQNSDEAIADDDLELSKTINLQLSDLAARGTESKIVYVTATNSPDAYSLSGRYTLKGNAMTVSVNIKQNKIIKTKFEINGTKDKLNELATAIAEKAAGIVK